MRNRFIIFGIIITVIGAGIAIAWEVFSYKPVQFELTGGGYSVTLFKDEDTEVSSVKETGEIKLKEGEYTYRVVGDKYNDNAVKITVSGNNTVVKVDPVYSTEYLTSLLEEEQPFIEAAISNAYGSKVSYTVNYLRLFQKGEWAAGTLNVLDDPRGLPDVYRIVLRKVNTAWTIVVPPQIAVYKPNYKDVPGFILNSLYPIN